MRKGRRRRRTTLRGWWRALPFLMAAAAIFFVFTWLNAQRLRNEYRAIELATEIKRVKDRIADLNGEQYRLGRMQRMDEAAPEHALREPDPGQIQIVHAGPEDLKAFAMAERPAPKPARPTRSVVVILDTPAAGAPAEVPSTAMAQKNKPEAEVGRGEL